MSAFVYAKLLFFIFLSGPDKYKYLKEYELSLPGKSLLNYRKWEIEDRKVKYSANLRQSELLTLQKIWSSRFQKNSVLVYVFVAGLFDLSYAKKDGTKAMQ